MDMIKLIRRILSLTVLIFISMSLLTNIGFAEKEKKEKDKKKKSKKEVVEEVEPSNNAEAGLPVDLNSLFPSDSTEDSSMSGILEWHVQVKDDNNNHNLNPKFRNWWYTKLEGVSTKAVSRVIIVGDGWKGRDYVLPVYSYDRKTWQRLRPEEVIPEKGSEGYFNYSIQKRFDSSVVWLARYYPYSLGRLNNFIKKHIKNPFFKVDLIGKTSHNRPLNLITITDPKVDDKNKKRIWIQSRTHPSETGSSFVLEGLIDYLLTDCNSCCKKVDLGKLIFNIIPIVNVDGVVEGNARLAPTGVDLERQWLRKSGSDNKSLIDTVAPEVKLISSKILELASVGSDFIAAFNFHSTNALPNERPFLFSNFRRSLPEHGAEGDTMLIRQLNFVREVSKEYCGDTLYLKTSYEPGVTMDKKIFPESWWWVNFKDKVVHGTIETTSGINGCFEEWVNWRDHLNLGSAIAMACQKYYNFFVEKKWFRYDAPSWDMKELLRYASEASPEK